MNHARGPVRTLVLLHAFPLDHRVWDEVVALLTSEQLRSANPGLDGWDVVAPDFRGCGGRSLADGGDVPEPDLDVLAEDVLRLLDERGAGRAVVAGVSLGGYVAMALLRRAPERVAAVALVDTKATADAEAARDNRLRIAGEMDAGGELAVLARAMVPTLVAEDAADEVKSRVRGWIEQGRPETVAWLQRAMAERPDSLDTLSGFAGPAAVVWGEADALSPWSEQEALLRSLREPVLVRLPGSGHLSPVEEPGGVATALALLLTDPRLVVAPPTRPSR